MKILKDVMLFLIGACSITHVFAQEIPKNEGQYDSLYAKRILLEEIDGVYIPHDLAEAFVELQRLSSPANIEKLKNASEDVARHKLHFGLGKWIILNWGFYEGSRLSHALKSAGLEHPDDMAKVILVCFHRHLNQKPLQFEEEVAFYRAFREKERLEREKQKTVIFEEKTVKKE